MVPLTVANNYFSHYSPGKSGYYKAFWICAIIIDVRYFSVFMICIFSNGEWFLCSFFHFFFLCNSISFLGKSLFVSLPHLYFCCCWTLWLLCSIFISCIMCESFLPFSWWLFLVDCLSYFVSSCFYLVFDCLSHCSNLIEEISMVSFREICWYVLQCIIWIDYTFLN